MYDSGIDFEKITAERFHEFFNCSNKNTKLDDRSGKKGYPLILVSNEISGTVSLLQVQEGYIKPQEQIDKEAAENIIASLEAIEAERENDKNAALAKNL